MPASKADLRPHTEIILVYVKLDPKETTLEPEFTRDVEKIGVDDFSDHEGKASHDGTRKESMSRRPWETAISLGTS